MAIMKEPLIDYGNDLLIYNQKEINLDKISELLLSKGYSGRTIDAIAGIYRFIPNNNGFHFIKLNTRIGALEFIYTSGNAKEKNQENLLNMMKSIDEVVN